MNATGKRRLLKLADFLETAELPGKFNMGKWSSGGSAVKNGKPMCGTAACAFGWATTIPSFRRAGLTMDIDGIPFFAQNRGAWAAMEFFDIGTAEEEELFEPDDMRDLGGKRGRRIVAKRIRALVASKAA